ncbi:MAG TPA: T9SS type A sorting domain-containing protein, partial [Ignavibacteriaceae bacterium]|nr:T9SS type A sorting domain-containing protein [Ignavibacteriaceae bacterium]
VILAQNFPNPFNPTTTIKYSIPVEANVSLIVYNSLGETVSSLVNSVQSSGNYQVTWNAQDFASGIYVYTLEVADMQNHNLFKDSRKIVLVK